MISETVFNLVVVTLIISISIHIGNWCGWYNDDEIENNHRKNHFKETK